LSDYGKIKHHKYLTNEASKGTIYEGKTPESTKEIKPQFTSVLSKSTLSNEDKSISEIMIQNQTKTIEPDHLNSDLTSVKVREGME